MHSLMHEFPQKRARVPKKLIEPDTGPCQPRRVIPKRPTKRKRPHSPYHSITKDLDVFKKIGHSEWRVRLAESATVPAGCFATFPSQEAAVAFAVQQRDTREPEEPKKRHRAPDKRRKRVRPNYPRKRAKRETPASPTSELDVPAEFEALLSSNVEDAITLVVAETIPETNAIPEEIPDTLACEELLEPEECQWSRGVSPLRLPDPIGEVVSTDSLLSGLSTPVLARVVRTPSVLDPVTTFTLKPLTQTPKPKAIFATTFGYSWENPVNFTFKSYVAPPTPPPVPQKKKRTPTGTKRPTWYEQNAELLLLSQDVLQKTTQLLASV